MPFISCEVCDFQSRLKNPKDQLVEVLLHEMNEHPKYRGQSLEDAFFDREMDMLEEEAHEKNVRLEDLVLDKSEERHIHQGGDL